MGYAEEKQTKKPNNMKKLTEFFKDPANNFEEAITTKLKEIM